MTHIKRQLRKCLSIIQPISRKRAIISHLNSLNTKRDDNDVGNSCP